MDPNKIGITGISLGAILSARACGFDSRITRAFLLLGGGDLRKIISTAREMRSIRAFIESLPPADQEKVWARIDHLDPLQAAEALRKLAGAGRLRMICAERDQVVLPDCSRKLAEAANCTNNLTWLPELDHYSAVASLPQILSDVVDFFRVDVPPAWQPPAATVEKTAAELVGSFLSGLAAFAQGEPAAESAHMMGVDVELTLEGKPRHVVVDYVRGQGGQFKLAGNYLDMGQIGLGQGTFPWLIGAGRMVFCGTQDVRDGAGTSTFISPDQMLKFRAVSGVLGVAALAPEILAKYWTLEEIQQTNGNRTVAVHVDYKRTQGTLKLDFAKDATPLRADWTFGNVTGRARFTHWKLNSAVADAVFEPPVELQPHNVRQEDLLRMFGAAFEFVVETLE